MSQSMGEGNVGPVYQLRHDELTWQEAGDVVVILDLSDSSYMSVGGSGRILWKRLEEPATVDDLVAAIVEVFDVDEATARRDTEIFLETLRGRRLITVVD